MATSRLLVGFMIVAAAVLAPALAGAVELKPGDIVIYDQGFGSRRVIVVDGDTGTQTVIPVAIGGTKVAIAITEDGQILVTSGSELKSVDPATGLVTTVASGPPLESILLGVDVEADGNVIVGQFESSAGVVRIDPTTGDSENISAGVGFGKVAGVAASPDGDIYAGPTSSQHVVRLAADGSLEQDYPMGSGFGQPNDIALRPTGELVIATPQDSIWTVETDTGVVRELVPDNVFKVVQHGIWAGQDGRILVPAQPFGLGDPDYAIYEIDPVTGAESIFLSGGAILQPIDVAVVETRPCDNGIDDDGDLLIDLADPGCATADDLSEEPDCDDGIDNDLDGGIDLAGDPGCDSTGDSSEQDVTLVCDNGIDDDSDGAIDAIDPGCDDALDPDEKSASLVCDNGLDDDGDGFIDRPDDPGCETPEAASEHLAGLDCDDGEDNDFDGLADLADPACEHPLDPIENPQCDDEIDNDNDGTVDWDGGQFGLTPDPQCGRAARNKESKRCGVGFEVAPLVAFASWRRRRRAARQASGRA